MTFLPILDRELRIRARARGTYWTRFAVALVGVLICLQAMELGASAVPGRLGYFVFNSVVAAGFLVSCSACLLTADAISGERRDGTLDLLLLTKVRGIDVLLGKLGSIGLTSFCALAAFLPVLMIPVLAGGVTGGDALRKGLALLDTLCLALGAGLCASAPHLERFKAARAALILMVALAMVPYLTASMAGRTFVRGVGVLSPLSLLISAGDVPYQASAGFYWSSLVAVQLLAWLLLASAGRRLGRVVREEVGPIVGALKAVREWMGGKAKSPVGAVAQPVISSSSSFSSWCSIQQANRTEDEDENENEAFRSHEDLSVEASTTPPADRSLGLWTWQPKKSETTPVEWLVYRQYGLNAGIWSLAVVGLAYLGWVPLAQRPVGVLGASSSLILSWPLGTAAGLVGASVLAWIASRFFVGGRRTGELECLLTTPGGADTTVAEQWKVLKRLFAWPVVVMQAPMLPKLLIESGSAGDLLFYNTVATVLSLANTFFGTCALCWLALWFGMRSRGQASAIVRAVILATGVPSLLGLLCAVMVGSFNGWPSGHFLLLSWLLEGAMLLYYIWLIRLAQERLQADLVGLETAASNWRDSILQSLRQLAEQVRRVAG
jgi:ABC-type transport system involved in multi-copper enzyme maturation permease subunit